MTTEKRERLARIAYEQHYDDEWVDAGDAQRALWRSVAAAVAAALVPPGCAVVERGRAERLIEFAVSCTDLEMAEPRSAVDLAVWDRWHDAFVAIQPGDLDPLPDG